jgi:hypothetical protein
MKELQEENEVEEKQIREQAVAVEERERIRKMNPVKAFLSGVDERDYRSNSSKPAATCVFCGEASINWWRQDGDECQCNPCRNKGQFGVAGAARHTTSP